MTREDKEKLQQDAASKYGLNEEQLREVEKQLEELASQRTSIHLDLNPEIDLDLLNRDVSTLSKQDKVDLLRAMHQRLQKLHQAMANPRNRGSSLFDFAGRIPLRGSNREKTTSNAYNSTGIVGKGKSAPKMKKNRSSSSRGSMGGSKKSSKYLDMIDDDDDFVMQEDTDEAEKIAMESDLSLLLAMGFGERQARDALEETGGNVEAAAEWIVSHCI